MLSTCSRRSVGIKARTAAVVFALEPVYGITVAWLLFNENPTSKMLIGGALIIVAIVVSARMSGHADKKTVAAEAASH